MELRQYLTAKDVNDNNVISIQSNDNNTTIITSKVNIKSKIGQKAMQAKERIELSLANGIDKQNNKRAFFARKKLNK